MEVRAKRVMEGQESGHVAIGKVEQISNCDGLDIGGRSRVVPPTYMAGGMELPMGRANL